MLCKHVFKAPEHSLASVIWAPVGLYRDDLSSLIAKGLASLGQSETMVVIQQYTNNTKGVGWGGWRGGGVTSPHTSLIDGESLPCPYRLAW